MFNVLSINIKTFSIWSNKMVDPLIMRLVAVHSAVDLSWAEVDPWLTLEPYGGIHRVRLNGAVSDLVPVVMLAF